MQSDGAESTRWNPRRSLKQDVGKGRRHRGAGAGGELAVVLRKARAAWVGVLEAQVLCETPAPCLRSHCSAAARSAERNKSAAFHRASRDTDWAHPLSVTAHKASSFHHHRRFHEQRLSCPQPHVCPGAGNKTLKSPALGAGGPVFIFGVFGR